jgi:hypothetical protein
MTKGYAMDGIIGSLIAALLVGNPAVPSQIARPDAQERIETRPIDTKRPIRLGGLPRHGQEILNGTLVRR